MAADLLSTISAEIEYRLGDLRPAIDEYEQLLLAAEALDRRQGAAAVGATRPATPRKPATARRPATPRKSTAPRKPATPRKPTAPRKPRAAAGPRTVARSRAGAAARGAAKAPRAPRGAAREAILAALDHGSHTVGELALVTAMSAPNINGNLRRLVAEGVVAKTQREGKTAYALPSPAS